MKAVSGKDFCKALRGKGWTHARTSGSHHVYTDGTRTVSVPVHGNRTLATGTQRALMRQTGLTNADL